MAPRMKRDYSKPARWSFLADSTPTAHDPPTQTIQTDRTLALGMKATNTATSTTKPGTITPEAEENKTDNNIYLHHETNLGIAGQPFQSQLSVAGSTNSQRSNGRHRPYSTKYPGTWTVSLTSSGSTTPNTKQRENEFGTVDLNDPMNHVQKRDHSTSLRQHKSLENVQTYGKNEITTHYPEHRQLAANGQYSATNPLRTLGQGRQNHYAPETYATTQPGGRYSEKVIIPEEYHALPISLVHPILGAQDHNMYSEKAVLRDNEAPPVPPKEPITGPYSEKVLKPSSPSFAPAGYRTSGPYSNNKIIDNHHEMYSHPIAADDQYAAYSSTRATAMHAPAGYSQQGPYSNSPSISHVAKSEGVSQEYHYYDQPYSNRTVPPPHNYPAPIIPPAGTYLPPIAGKNNQSNDTGYRDLVSTSSNSTSSSVPFRPMQAQSYLYYNYSKSNTEAKAAPPERRGPPLRANAFTGRNGATQPAGFAEDPYSTHTTPHQSEGSAEHVKSKSKQPGAPPLQIIERQARTVAEERGGIGMQPTRRPVRNDVFNPNKVNEAFAKIGLQLDRG